MAEQNNTLHKGWLTTRDGAKFAPATLIENVFSRDGTSYDAKIREYIQSEVSSVDGDLTEAIQTVKNRVDTLDSKVDSSVQRLDDKDSEIENKLSNFGDDQGDRLYIIDKDNNVVAYVDQNGVTSTNFVVPGVTNFQAEHEVVESLQERMQTAEGDIDDIETALRNIDVNTDDDTFYIIDSQENVIAYINGDGVHSINFIVDNEDSEYADYLALLEQVELNIEEIKGLKQTDNNLREDLTNFSNAVNTKLQYFNGEEDEVFFFIDKEDNVIAYIDQYGIHTTGLHATDSGLTVENALYVYNKMGETIFTATSDDGISASNLLIKAADGTVVYNLINTLKDLANEDNHLSEVLVDTNERLNQEIADRIEGDEKLQQAIDETNARTAHLDGTEDERLYIIDKNDNVVAYVDAVGIHAIEFITEPYSTGTNLRTTRYEMTELGDSVEKLETWQPNAQQEIDRNEADITRLYGIAGEDRGADIADGYDHKSRLNKIDDILDLESFAKDGQSNRLNRLDTIVGKSDDDVFQTTHEGRLKAVEAGLATEADTRSKADIAHKTAIEALETKTEYLEATSNDKFYIVDSSNNVIAYFDESGLTVTELTATGLKINQSGRYEAVYDGSSPYLLSHKLAEIFNTLLDHSAMHVAAANERNAMRGRLDVQEGVTGETTIPSQSHKTRLDAIDIELGLSNGAYTRFSSDEARILAAETLIGKREDAANAEVNQSHEARIKSNNDRVLALETVFQKQTNGTFQEYERIKNLLGRTSDTAAESGSHESRIKNLRNDLDDVEERLDNVSNVMDFIGSFTTYDDLLAYENPNNGDVAIVTSTSTEYVYNNSWVELGNSSATQTAIANLQEIVGETKLSGSTSHKTRLEDLENNVNILNSTTGANINYLHSTINYLGRFTAETIKGTTPHLGDLAHIDNFLKIYNYEWDSTSNILIYSWQPYSGLSRKLYNVDGSDDDTLYITDKCNNVIATFDINGLTTVDLRLLKTNGQFTSKSTMMFMSVTDEDKYTLN